MEKKWKNESGTILVRPCQQTDHYVVEMMHLWKDNEAGCVVAFWEKRESDGSTIAEVRSVGARLMDTPYDAPEILLKALKYGQKLADVMLESKEEQ